ncbi:MAG TPA: hypothetical protein VFY70_08245 [Thermomicrobiales bacterium]|nr:hypothetical protein [Thermomicrobiales bacterium]
MTLAGERPPLSWDPFEERESDADCFPAVAAWTKVTLRNARADQLVL